MQNQTIHTSFEPSDMKEYAYMITTRLNALNKGKAEPVYDRAGIWDIVVKFDNFNFKYRAPLCKYFTTVLMLILQLELLETTLLKRS